MTNPTTTANRSLASQLVALTKGWGAHTLVPDAEKNRAVEIGVALHAAGGKALMRAAYFSAKAVNRHATVLSAYWGGIGDWRW